MFLREKVEKSNGKEYFHKSFSNWTNVDYWESVYGQQDFMGSLLRRRMWQALSWLDNSNLSKNSKILDVGCGAGVMAKEVANRGYEVFGMDYSYNMIKKANALCGVNMKFDMKFLQGDIESLPFKDSVFDMVLCLGVITYLKSEKKALREMSRVLKPDGTLILSILNKVSLAKCFDIPVLVKRRLQKTVSNIIVSLKKRTEIKKNYFAQKSYFIPSLRNSLKNAGFAESDCVAVQYGPLTFFGRNILPDRISIDITTILEKFSNTPLIRSFGGMCLFKLTKVR